MQTTHRDLRPWAKNSSARRVIKDEKPEGLLRWRGHGIEQAREGEHEMERAWDGGFWRGHGRCSHGSKYLVDSMS
jgi:hypothetical protein